MGGFQSGWVRYSYSLTTALGLALDSLRAHKLRSFLTLLGVIIGVGSVVLVGAAIEGMGLYAEQSTSKIFGSESFLLAQVGTAGNYREYIEKLKRNKRIRAEDLVYLEATTGDRVLYSPYRQRGEEFKHAGTTFEEGVLLGVGAALPEIRDVTLVEGRFFTEQEQRTRQYVAVIGEDVRALLYPNATAVGKQLKIRGLDFEIIGVQEKLGSAFGRSQDNSVYIPYTVFARLYGTGQSVSVFGRPRPGLTLEEALDISRVSLRTRFRARPGQPDRFDTVTPDAIRSFIDNMLKMISAVVVPVTGISLVVGGIVIMNIMLVSVTERTHEIGVRKSLGARQVDIRRQFLIEAVVLATLGGLVGVALGATLTSLLARVFEISMRVTAVYVVLSLVVSSVVGIFSGWYPAARASKLDPVAALRAE